MKEKLTNTQKIENFFESIYLHDSATKEDIQNFLRNCLKFVFDLEKVNLEDYEINFRPIKENLLNNAEACVVKDDKYLNKFSIYFLEKYTSFKGYSVKQKKSSENIHSNNDKEFVSRMDYMADYLNFIYTMFHEFHHVMQYIKKPKHMKKFDNTKRAIEELLVSINDFDLSKKDKDKASRALQSHENAMDFVSHIEREADKKAHFYFTSLLDLLIFCEQNETMLCFYDSVYRYVNAIRKDEFFFYRKYNKKNAQSLKVLKKYDIDKNELLS